MSEQKQNQLLLDIKNILADTRPSYNEQKQFSSNAIKLLSSIKKLLLGILLFGILAVSIFFFL